MITTAQKRVHFRRWITPLALGAIFVAVQGVPNAEAQEPAPPAQELENSFPKKPPYSPYAGRHFPERVYWVGDTVDVPNATYTNTIGASELIKVWKDPDFDAAQRAFYYVRVLEIPTPRWTAYDAKYYGITMPPEVPMKGQERAYTSPIWYTPGK